MLKFKIGICLFFITSMMIAQSSTNYNAEIEQWKIARINALKAENGWLNLVGLYWLNEGNNSFGIAKSNSIIFPKGSIVANAGNLFLKNQMVKLTPASGVAIKVNDKIVKTTETVYSKELEKSASMSYGSLHWTIIRREDKIGIRLRDYNSSLVKTFKGADRFPTDSNWRIEAILQAPANSSTIPITNVLGQTIQMKLLGKLQFNINKQIYSLDVVEEETALFVIFGDLTNKKETYGAGRFMYIPAPDSSGRTVIDFNKAFNPPCVFTPYATCPLPPKQNMLPIPITAGEKNYIAH
jgi:uncharacterized protein (DUF1684 family)